jgi:hypothetical protein
VSDTAGGYGTIFGENVAMAAESFMPGPQNAESNPTSAGCCLSALCGVDDGNFLVVATVPKQVDGA